MKERYLIRAAKYFLYLVALFVVLYSVLILLGYSSIDTFILVFSSDRGWIMIAAFVVLPLLYPMFGFVKREIRASSTDDRSAIMRTMSMNGYELASETEDGVLTFRAITKLAKFRMLYEDKITVTPDDNYIIVSGPRKEVVKTEFRLKTFM